MQKRSSPRFERVVSTPRSTRSRPRRRWNSSQHGTTLTARANAPGGGTIVLRKDGRLASQHPLPELTFDSKGEHGTYRVEVYLSNAPGDPPVPWIVSNPIYIRPTGWGKMSPAVGPAVPTITLSVQGGPWHVENDGASTAQVSQTEPPRGPAEFSYRLADGTRAGQYAALVIGVGKALTERAHLALRASAQQPMRISVQARHPRSGARWQTIGVSRRSGSRRDRSVH